MSTQRDERIPQLTMGWRLKMALGDIPVHEMADYLGVTRSTLSRWMGDKGTPPKRAYLAQWALRTNVPLEWLEHGGFAPDGGGDGRGVLPGITTPLAGRFDSLPFPLSASLSPAA